MREQCFNQPLVLHSDNRVLMKSLTYRAKMDELDITSSYSRPRVSDDNPYVESLCRTCLTGQPKALNNWMLVAVWVEAFVRWYNTEYNHSKLNYVTLSERHSGKDSEILRRRSEVLLIARERHPAYWARKIRNSVTAPEVLDIELSEYNH